MKKDIKASHLEARHFIKGTGIPERTFYNKVAKHDIDYIEPFNSWRMYSVKDWNKKVPEYKLELN